MKNKKILVVKKSSAKKSANEITESDLIELDDKDLKKVIGGTWDPRHPTDGDYICPECHIGEMNPSEDTYPTETGSYDIWTCDHCGYQFYMIHEYD